VWITRDPNTGTHYVIDELYRAGMLPEEFARRVLAIERDPGFPRGSRNRVLDEVAVERICTAGGALDKRLQAGKCP
jgi:hypothetical protein